MTVSGMCVCVCVLYTSMISDVCVCVCAVWRCDKIGLSIVNNLLVAMHGGAGGSGGLYSH